MMREPEAPSRGGARHDDAADSGKGKKRRVEGAGSSGASSDAVERMKKVVTAVASTTRHGRRLAFLFLKLPTEAEAPGYYDVVREPISLGQMRERLKGGVCTLEQLDADMNQMVRNAHTYNAPESQIYEDANTLLAVYQEARTKHFPEAA